MPGRYAEFVDMNRVWEADVADLRYSGIVDAEHQERWRRFVAQLQWARLIATIGAPEMALTPEQHQAWLGREADVIDPPEPYRIEDTCCGKCVGGTCYVDQVTGA
jgi:hypothetical protein